MEGNNSCFLTRLNLVANVNLAGRVLPDQHNRQAGLDGHVPYRPAHGFPHGLGDGFSVNAFRSHISASIPAFRSLASPCSATTLFRDVLPLTMATADFGRRQRFANSSISA